MQHVDSLPYKLRHRARRVLEAGERVVWVGRPVPRCFTPESRGIFVFAIPWTALSCTFALIVWDFSPPDLSLGSADWAGFFVAPFVLIGFAMLCAPLYARYAALGAAYLITDRRAVIFEGGFLKKNRIFPPRKLRRLSRVERRNGLGDLIFETRTIVKSEDRIIVKSIGFKNIHDPAEVERMLVDLVDAADNEGAPR